MKSIILLLTVVLSNGTSQKQTFSFDTMQECAERVNAITSHSYPFQLKAECLKVVPEVEENAYTEHDVKPV